MGALLMLLPQLLPLVLPAIMGSVDKYTAGQISREQLEADIKQGILDSFTKISQADAEAISKTFASFMDAAKSSRLMQWTWAIVTLSQLAVLIWHQVGISALSFYTGKTYPSSGSTVEWAYLLVAFCLGAGPVVLRAGPGSGNLLDKLKGLVK